MSDETNDRMIVFAVGLAGREVAQQELVERYSLKVTPAVRARLVKKDLIEVGKITRGKKQVISLKIADAGWEWMDRELGSQRPEGGRSAGSGIFYALINGLGEYVARRKVSLRDLLEGSGSAVPHKEPMQPVSPGASLEDQIRSAYGKLAKRRHDWVPLRELRSLLGGAAKTEVDSVLKQMYADKQINLTLEEDQKRLKQDDRDAAIRIGITDMHFISME